MEEQLQAPRPQKSKKPLIALLAILIAVGLGAYFWLTRSSADPAAYLPKEVAVAATIDLTKSADKDAALDMIRSIFKDAGMDKPEKELFKALNEELKIDFEKDVVSHLSGTAAGAVLPEMNAMIPAMVAVVCAKSEGDADSVVKTIQDQLKRNKIGFKKLTYKGMGYFRIAASDPTQQMTFGPQLVNYVGAVKSGIVWASSEGAFKKVIDTAKGAPSLLKEANFTKLRKVKSSTFATFYLSGAGYYKLISPMMSMAGGEMPAEFKEQLENVEGSGTADANGEGIRLESVSVTKKPMPKFKNAALDDMLAGVPANAKVVYAIKSWDKLWVEMKKSMMANPMIKQQMDQSLAQAQQMMGFDPMGDLLDRLTSFTAYYVPGKMANDSQFPGAITLVLTADKPAVVEASLAKLHAFAASAGQMKVSKALADGQQVSVLPLDGDNMKMADTVMGSNVVLTFAGPDTVKAVTAAVSTLKGKTKTLASSPDYQLVKKSLPAQGMGLVYGDIGGVVSVFRELIPTDDRKKVEAVFEHVGLVGMTSEVNGTESTGAMIVPFKK